MEEIENSTLLCFGQTEWLEEERDVGEEGKRYKYPPAPNGYLSRDSATAQVRQCLSSCAALPRLQTSSNYNSKIVQRKVVRANY